MIELEKVEKPGNTEVGIEKINAHKEGLVTTIQAALDGIIEVDYSTIAQAVDKAKFCVNEIDGDGCEISCLIKPASILHESLTVSLDCKLIRYATGPMALLACNAWCKYWAVELLDNKNQTIRKVESCYGLGKFRSYISFEPIKGIDKI